MSLLQNVLDVSSFCAKIRSYSAKVTQCTKFEPNPLKYEQKQGSSIFMAFRIYV